MAILDAMYGLRMFDDLLNPVLTTPEATPGLFKKAEAAGACHPCKARASRHWDWK